MILPTDIPTRAQVDRLLEHRASPSVTVYLATDPASIGTAERIELKTLVAEASSHLQTAGVGVRSIRALEEQVADLLGDAYFWRYQARTLAVFATPESLITFRLPNRLLTHLAVSDRFYVKPLLRALTFPHVAFVLALAQGSVRVIEVAADMEPAEIKVEDLPSDVASSVGKSSIADRAPMGRLQGSEGQKVRMRQYARQIDQALRPLLNGLDVPLVLASASPIDAIYRSVNTYPHLLLDTIPGNPDTTSNADLAARARTMLDQLYAAQLRDVRELFGRRTSDGRAFADIAHVARAATYGSIETLLVDIDAVVPGTLDERTGAVTFAEETAGDAYGVTDEIARRAWMSGARVLAVRSEDLPNQEPVAAILRYPL